MAARGESIITRQCRALNDEIVNAHKSAAEAELEARKVIVFRVAPMIYRHKGRRWKINGRTWNVQLDSLAAARYFHKRLADLMRELDGIVIIEDPPAPKGD